MPAHIAIFNHSESLLLLFKTVLSRLGYKVTTHLQDLTTIDDVKQMHPDLIILGWPRSAAAPVPRRPPESRGSCGAGEPSPQDML